VLRDLPLIIEQLQLDHPGLVIDVAQAAGEDPAVLGAIADYCVAQVRQPER
jgi:sirohydrochlorin cobaltochelatase